MSLSLPERLRVVLAPGEIVLLRPGLLWRRAPREAQRFPCAAQDAQEAWQPPLQRLADVLDAQGAARLRLGFVLSNHFVRYQVVPWRRELVRPAEREALARHGFVRVYGERAAGWRIRLGDGPWGAATLACAVDEALLARIAAFAAGRGLRVESIEPHLVRAFNRFRRRLGGPGALALLEPGRLCLAVFGRGEWTAVHSQRLEPGAAPADALLRLLRSAGLGHRKEPSPFGLGVLRL